MCWSEREHADALASNFSILDGSVDVEVPSVDPGNDYRVVREFHFPVPLVACVRN
jgi:hypothetical protein